jgi:hypothetical protein
MMLLTRHALYQLLSLNVEIEMLLMKARSVLMLLHKCCC